MGSSRDSEPGGLPPDVSPGSPWSSWRWAGRPPAPGPEGPGGALGSPGAEGPGQVVQPSEQDHVPGQIQMEDPRSSSASETHM